MAPTPSEHFLSGGLFEEFNMADVPPSWRGLKPMSGVNSEETVGGPNACHRVRVSSWNIHLGCVFQAWRLVAADFC